MPKGGERTNSPKPHRYVGRRPSEIVVRSKTVDVELPAEVAPGPAPSRVSTLRRSFTVPLELVAECSSSLRGDSRKSPGHRQRERERQFRERHGDEAESITRQVAEIKARIQKTDRWSRCVLHPGKSNGFLTYWDVVTSVALLWTVFVSPFEAVRRPSDLAPYTSEWRHVVAPPSPRARLALPAQPAEGSIRTRAGLPRRHHLTTSASDCF